MKDPPWPNICPMKAARKEKIRRLGMFFISIHELLSPSFSNLSLRYRSLFTCLMLMTVKRMHTAKKIPRMSQLDASQDSIPIIESNLGVPLSRFTLILKTAINKFCK